MIDFDKAISPAQHIAIANTLRGLIACIDHRSEITCALCAPLEVKPVRDWLDDPITIDTERD